MKYVLILAAASLAISGCATKRYGRLQPLTMAEVQAYDCRQLDIEMAKVEAFRQQVSDGAEFNFASVAGFLGDWGIGNSMEKNSAEKSATQRMNDLMAARANKQCGSTTVTKAEQTAIEKQVEDSATVPASATTRGLKQGSGVTCTTCAK